MWPKESEGDTRKQQMSAGWPIVPNGERERGRWQINTHAMRWLDMEGVMKGHGANTH